MPIVLKVLVYCSLVSKHLIWLYIMIRQCVSKAIILYSNTIRNSPTIKKEEIDFDILYMLYHAEHNRGTSDVTADVTGK